MSADKHRSRDRRWEMLRQLAKISYLPIPRRRRRGSHAHPDPQMLEFWGKPIVRCSTYARDFKRMMRDGWIKVTRPLICGPRDRSGHGDKSGLKKAARSMRSTHVEIVREHGGLTP